VFRTPTTTAPSRTDALIQPLIGCADDRTRRNELPEKKDLSDNHPPTAARPTYMRTRLCLTTAFALLLLTSCVDAVDEAAVPPEPGGGSTSEPPRSDLTPADTNAADSPDGPQIQTGQRSGPYDLELEDVRVVEHEGGDRIVLTFAGDGKPGWVVRYVDEAVVDGSGQVVNLDGDAILQLDLSGTPTQASGTTRPVHRSLAGDVVDLHALRAWEGVTQVFLGIDGGRTPFQVSALTTPSRLVLDVD
jgi:hypothetical protein